MPRAADVPEGSFKWERVAKSSAVSSKGGLRRGGRPSLFSLISFPVVLMTISWGKVRGGRAEKAVVTDLASLVDEDELDGVVTRLCDTDDLCGNPGVVLVLEPDTGALAVYVFSHGLTSKRSEEAEALWRALR